MPKTVFVEESITDEKVNHILTTPLNGWSTFTLGSFMGNCSYLTCVAFDVLDTILTYYKNETASIHFDEEGSDVYVTITPYATIIHAQRETCAHYCIHVDADKVINCLIEDITRNLSAWAEFNSNDTLEYEINHKKLKKKLKEAIKCKKSGC